MRVRLQDLIQEGLPTKPPLSRLPDIRKVGAALVSYIRKNVGKDVIKRWELDEVDGRGIVRVYLPVTHHNPHQNFWNQPLPRLLKAADTFKASLRMFGDGNLICIEWTLPPVERTQ